MKLHKGAHKFILLILSIAAVDLLTRRLWCIMLYGAAWAVILLRQSRRIQRRANGIIAPVSGIVRRVFKSKVDAKEVNCIRIDTRPIVDPQTFRSVPVDTIDSIKFTCDAKSVIYKSGLVVKHSPLWNCASMSINQENMDLFNDVGTSPVYGYSLFGCTTNIILPHGYSTSLIEGQKVIDSETVIGEIQ